MRYGPTEWRDKLGRNVVIRSAEVTDSEALLELLRTTAEQTAYLIREPEEVTMTLAQEAAFVQGRIDAPRELMLVAQVNGRYAGLCSLSGCGPFRRYDHRCDVSIALCREYWGAGIGRKLLETLLTTAKELGYEQAELEVIAENSAARSLYKKLGFTEYGHFPRNMKYRNGTYADAVWMMKRL